MDKKTCKGICQLFEQFGFRIYNSLRKEYKMSACKALLTERYLKARAEGIKVSGAELIKQIIKGA